MTTNKQPRHPGIHLHKTTGAFSASSPDMKPQYYWHLVASNGRIIARSSETYTRKRNAINSIRVAADLFRFEFEGKYYENGEVRQIVNKKNGKG